MEIIALTRLQRKLFRPIGSGTLHLAIRWQTSRRSFRSVSNPVLIKALLFSLLPLLHLNNNFYTNLRPQAWLLCHELAW